MVEQALTLGPFRLDPRSGLKRGERLVRLTPKALAVLGLLVAERDRVVSKEEIFRVVWRGAVVGDAALATCIRELRSALHDNARKPRYIETLHRRGYRLLPSPGAPAGHAMELPGLTGPDAGMLVGRGRELAALDSALASARAGTRQVVFVAGEAGIGKTSLARAFVSRAGDAGAVQLAWGQSAEHYGPSEPYHPILDAVTRACRAGNVTLLQAFEAHAPLWLAQMPSLLSRERLRSVQRRCVGATPERMQRELTDALEAAADCMPLVVWLEDLHWADTPTVEWLASFARRPERARVLLLTTYRLSEARSEGHPLYTLRDELLRQGRVSAIFLGSLDREAVEAYVTARFQPAPRAASALARIACRVFERTGGSPLFMIGMLSELVSRGLLLRVGDRWSVAARAANDSLEIPSYLRELIDRQLSRLAPEDVSLLEVGSVAGLRFCAALLASVTNRPVQEVDRSCARVARDRGLLVPAGVEAWPDGTLSTRYGFAHALYREAVASRLPVGLAVQVHRRVGERLSVAYRGFADEVAGQIALHFEQGRELAAAVKWLQKAGDAAQRRKAAREAAAHYDHALELLVNLPLTRQYDVLRGSLQLSLCVPFIAMHGMGSPEVERCAATALERFGVLGSPRGTFAARRILWNHSLMHYPVVRTLRHARQLMAQAKASRDAAELAFAHRALGCSLIYAGDFFRAATLLEQGARIANPIPARRFVPYGEHAGMVCRSFCAWPKAFMGLRDEAMRLSEDAIEQARRTDEPQQLAFALVTAGLVYLFHRDVDRAASIAAEVAVLANKYGLAQWIAFADEIRGWVAFRTGQHMQGIALMSQALHRLHATGGRTHSSRLLASLAESCLLVGDVEESRRYLDAALKHRAEHGEEYYAAELLRLHALILERQGAAAQEVGAVLQAALAVARRQKALLFEERVRVEIADAGSSTDPASYRQSFAIQSVKRRTASHRLR